MSARRHRVIDQPIHDLATHPAPYITVNVLAEYLSVERDSIIRLIQAGRLDAIKMGRVWRIPTAAAQRLCHLEHTGEAIVAALKAFADVNQ